MRILVTCLLVLCSLSAFSARMVITGRPVELELHRGFYTVPETYIERKGYFFITFIATPRVCFLQSKPEYSSLDMVQVIIEDQGQQLRWNCYRYDPRFFEIDF